MTETEPLYQGREAFARGAWWDAYRGLAIADQQHALELDDLERFATAAHMLGRVDDAARTWERAYHAAVERGEIARSVHDAFHIIMGFGQRGEFAQAGGWHARATRMLDESGLDASSAATCTSRRASSAFRMANRRRLSSCSTVPRRSRTGSVTRTSRPSAGWVAANA